ncbi:MAG: molecular chaperone DnaK [Candidatus Aegiribacteria sp.]|nr:molecular chaperone DnaK [Candidatus Aegiribacteria sp.]MBD3294695.1 molecular chaperone DnaK [Candidatus Fermentibacteria bacterium]
MGSTIGIDLGTTNSCMAISEGGNAVVIQTGEGPRVMPSVVAFTPAGDRLVGIVAKRQAITNPKDTIISIKRLMGRKYDELQKEAFNVSYDIVPNEKGDAVVKIGDDRTFTPQEISSMILQKMKYRAEEFLGEEVTDVVVTVPAHFNEVQRKATKAACTIAGLNVKRVLNEPTAAALAFTEAVERRKIAVFDFGGGTFDISILQVVNGIFEVKATTGNTQLGGDDFDTRLVDWIMEEFKRDKGIDLREDPVAPQRVREAAERAKCELSSALETTINLPFIASGDEGPVHLEMSITRGLFEGLIEDLVESTRPLCKQVMKDAGLTCEDLETVVLVGGSTRIPIVRTLVEETFKQEPVHSVNPDEVVAMGAAIAGSVVSGQRKDLVLLDVTSLTLGVETLGGVMAPIIEKNSPLPIKRSKMFTTAVDNQQVVGIHVLQGERTLAEENRSLARFELVGINPAPRGVPRIEVSFSIDANGILFVNAKDAVTGKHQEMKVNPSGGLSDEDIRELIQEARQHRESDRERAKLVEKRNIADQSIYEASRLLNTSRDSMDTETAGELKASLEELRSARDTTDMARIEEALKDLAMVMHTTKNILKMVDSIDEDEENSEGLTTTIQ